MFEKLLEALSKRKLDPWQAGWYHSEEAKKERAAIAKKGYERCPECGWTKAEGHPKDGIHIPGSPHSRGCGIFRAEQDLD